MDRDPRGTLRLPLLWLETLWQDLRYSGRLLARAPAFAISAAACLAIGIGVNTVVYTNLSSLVLGELPAVRNPKELARFQTPVAYGDWEAFRGLEERAGLEAGRGPEARPTGGGEFSSLAAFMGQVPFVLALPGAEPERLWGNLVTPNYFETLGVRPREGRLFDASEQAKGGAVAVISHRLWQRRFNGAASAAGLTVRINGQPVTVVGVAPENFAGASPMLAGADLWIPTTAPASVAPELAGLAESRAARFELIGRMKPGTTFARAEAVFEPLARRQEQIYNDPNQDHKESRVRLLPGGRIFPIRDEDIPRTMGLPTVLAGLILLMACSNIANMLVARGEARRKEFAIRLSIGAGRGRLVRQLLTEGLLLVLLGVAGGALIARAASAGYQNMLASFPAYIHLDFRTDWHAWAVSAVFGLISGVLFGLAPALNAVGGDISASLKPGAGRRRDGARRSFSLRNILVAQQLAASVVLLLLTGFVVVGSRRAGNTNLGFDFHHLVLLNLDPVRDGYDAKRSASYFDRLPKWLARIPGVESVALAQTLPVAFAGGESLATAKVELLGGPKALGAIRSDRVGAEFFETVGIPIVRGRGFNSRDITEDDRVLIVNETMASQVWGAINPVGQTLEFDGRPREVIGIARDIRPPVLMGLPQPAVYRPIKPSAFGAPSQQGVTVVVRVRPGFDAAASLRRETASFDANVTVFNVRRMEDVVAQVYFMLRIATSIYGGLGIFALILATAGLAGVTAYSVARRTHEIGIRVALGATRYDVTALVMRESVAIVAIGGVIGFALALAAMRALSAVMDTLAEATRTTKSDPVILAGAPALLVSLALLACYLPARRTAKIDPAAALKAE